jgi:DNA-binding IscR family transcriptional regulator
LPALDPHKAAEEWNVPTRVLNETLHALKEAGLVTECAGDPPTYQPGRSLDRMEVADILRVLREAGKEPSALRDEPSYRDFLETLTVPVNGSLRASLADTIRDQRLLIGPAKES